MPRWIRRRLPLAAQQRPIQVLFLRVQDAWVLGRLRVVVDQQLLSELPVGPQLGYADLDVAVWTRRIPHRQPGPLHHAHDQIVFVDGFSPFELARIAAALAVPKCSKTVQSSKSIEGCHRIVAC